MSLPLQRCEIFFLSLKMSDRRGWTLDSIGIFSSKSSFPSYALGFFFFWSIALHHSVSKALEVEIPKEGQVLCPWAAVGVS